MIGYCCRGGGRVGLGHLARARALMEVGDENLVLVVPEESLEVARWATGGAAARLRLYAGASPPASALAGLNVLVVDDYEATDAWLADVAAEHRVVLIDDWQRTAASADVLVNPNFGARHSDYPMAHVGTFALGGAYAFVRREFLSALPERRANSIAITFGAADSRDSGACIARALMDTTWWKRGGIIDVIAGRSMSAPDRAVDGTGQVRIHVKPQNFAAICGQATAVICASSTVSHEMAALGKAFVPVAIVDNQRLLGARWAEAGFGRSLHIDWPEWVESTIELALAIVEDTGMRVALEAKARTLVDGKGAERLWSMLAHQN